MDDFAVPTRLMRSTSVLLERVTVARLALSLVAAALASIQAVADAAPVTVTALGAGTSHSCGVLSDMTVKCWGNSGYGQLGFGQASAQLSAPGAPVGSINNAVAVAVAEDSSCALLSTGSVQCWGRNDYGQLGNSDNAHSSYPVTVSTITTATAVACGGHACCALLPQSAPGTSNVMCWGLGGDGQLGNGANGNSNKPVPVSGINTAIAVTVGRYHACALLSGGTVKCWGNGYNGQLGRGNTQNSNTPVTVQSITTAIAVSAGGYQCCAVLSSGTVQCWGDNGNGQLGDSSNTQSTVPVTVLKINTDDVAAAVAVSCGYYHSCAVLIGGGMHCWGWGAQGRLGNGGTTSASTPVVVSGVTSAVALKAGGAHTCALLSNGVMQCWGKNEGGQLGRGSTSDGPTAANVLFDYPSPSPSPSDSVSMTPSDSVSATPSDSVSMTPSDSASVTPSASDSPSTTPSPVCSPGWTALTLPPDCVGTLSRFSLPSLFRDLVFMLDRVCWQWSTTRT